MKGDRETRQDDQAANSLAYPGEVLRELLRSSEITQDDLASAIGVTRYSINQVVNGRRSITPGMALRLSKALSTTAEFWLNLQVEVDLAELRAELRRDLAAIPQLRGAVKAKDLFYNMVRE